MYVFLMPGGIVDQAMLKAQMDCGAVWVTYEYLQVVTGDFWLCRQAVV